MERPDLYYGDELSYAEHLHNKWQVIDATPQEKSDEMYRCGPAAVVVTRKGEIHRPFDTSFVYSEVNADKVYWLYRGENKPLRMLGKKDDAYGKIIMTRKGNKIIQLLVNVCFVFTGLES